MRAARDKVPGLPPGFRHFDLRHYFASLLISSGADVKVVQARLRHASAKTTLDTYGHLWPDAEQGTRAAVDAVFLARGEEQSPRLRLTPEPRATYGLFADCGLIPSTKPQVRSV
jgi:hypothetical protein